MDKPFGQVEAEQAKKLADLARQVSLSALSDTTIAASTVLLARVSAKDGGSALGEPSRDLVQIRTDPALMQALSKDLVRAQNTTLILVRDALWDGYKTASVTRVKGLPIVVDLTEQDRADLAGYPIAGFNAREVAEELAHLLKRGVDSALAIPLTSPTLPQTIPVALGAEETAHADRVARAVDEAFATGVGAAVRAIGQTMVGA